MLSLEFVQMNFSCFINFAFSFNRELLTNREIFQNYGCSFFLDSFGFEDNFIYYNGSHFAKIAIVCSHVVHRVLGIVWSIKQVLQGENLIILFGLLCIPRCQQIQEFGKTEIRDLKTNGRELPVTEANKREYVQLACQMKMTGSIRSQIKSFLEGFYEVIPKSLISIFNEQELELLISGLPSIDIDDLKANSEYHKYTTTSLQVSGKSPTGMNLLRSVCLTTC